MVALTADVGLSSRLSAFQTYAPERLVNTGIAEQSLISVAAGMASEGVLPMCHAFAPFLTMRCFEQIRTDLCYPNLPAVLVGNGAGYSNGISGPTHCALEDVAIMGACINMTVMEPSDPYNVEELLVAALNVGSPVYVRLSKNPLPQLYSDTVSYEVGKAITARDGDDGAFICSGSLVHTAMEAAQALEDELGLHMRVVDMHTLKPLDVDAVYGAAQTGRIVAAQDHNICGGLGQLVAQTLGEAGISCPLAMRGCPEEFVPIATPEFLYERNGMDVAGLVKAMKSLL